MAKSVLDIIITLKKQGGADKETIKGLVQLKTSITQTAAVAGSLVAAGYAIKTAFDATVGSTVKLADEVRGIQQVSRLSAEESSRLVQITDDFKISQEELLKVMQKNGDQYDYSVAGLAKMSDEYNALTDANQKADYMQERFGKNWGNFVELMEQGGDRIRAAGDDINQALIFDQAALDSAREYQKQLDELEDSWLAVRVAAGQAILPETVTFLQDVNAEIEEENGQLFQAEKGWRMLLGPIGAVWNAIDLFTNSNDTATGSIQNADAARWTGLASLYATRDGLTQMGDAAADSATDYAGLIGMMQSLNSETTQQIKITAFQQLQNDLKKSGNELTASESELLRRAGIEMGIFSQQSADNAAAIMELNAQLQDGIITLEQYIEQLNAIPTEISTNVNTSYTSTGTGQTQTYQALGGPQTAGLPYYVHQDEMIVPASDGFTLTRRDAMKAVENALGGARGGNRSVNIYGNITVMAQGSIVDALEELGA